MGILSLFFRFLVAEGSEAGEGNLAVAAKLPKAARAEGLSTATDREAAKGRVREYMWETPQMCVF